MTEANENKTRTAKFQIGQVVKHRLFPFRGVVFDIDPEFNNTEEWWLSIPAEVMDRIDPIEIIGRERLDHVPVEPWG